MGYACPVCEEPQADAAHLANHLAFTAMIGREDHEAWLDEHAPGWAQEGTQELAAVVSETLPEEEFEEFADADHDHATFEDDLARHAGYGRDAGRGGATDADVESVLAEARELTRRMRGDDEAENE
ncbi:DUF5810 domain-containing protein [Halobacteriaceae archaeon GCM10025711]